MTEQELSQQFKHLTDDNPLWRALTSFLLSKASEEFNRAGSDGLSCCDRALAVGASRALTDAVTELNAMRQPRMEDKKPE